MAECSVIPYTPDWAQRWDAFVMEDSQNGTFLQTRRFLGYHPAQRFTDASLLVTRENGELLAVVPAAACEAENGALYCSHPGSTFGGPVLSRRAAQAEPVLAVVDALDAYLCGRYAACELRITPQLFAAAPTELLEYALFNRGYGQETALAAYLPVAGREMHSLRAAYSATKRYELRRCERAGLSVKALSAEAEIAAFHALLRLNLQKFGVAPVHTLAELMDFLLVRLREEIRFLGVYDPSGAMVAGACLFYFRQTNTLHAQYLATDTRIRAYAPSAFLYDSVLRAGLEMGAATVSFGTSTRERGHALNAGLIQNKEGYGCLHTLNRLFTKQYGRTEGV